MRYKPENYDIINELDPKNRFDKLAGEAHIEGTKYRDRTLVNSGTELAALIRELPYGDDKYYLLIQKADEIEQRIKTIRKEYASGEKEVESFVSSTGCGFWLIHNPKEDSLVIEMGTGRTSDPQGIQTDPVRSKFRKKILNWLESKGISQKEDHSNTRVGHYPNRSEIWKDATGRRVFYDDEFTHDNAEGSGIYEKFYFYGPAQDFAEQAWQEIKSDIIKSSER